jgi:rfaE bifunctional protein kinase chain/domain
MVSDSIDQLFEDFSKLNCLIIGDVMVDAYLWGNVNRISPEAPVPVFEVKKRENRLGGAANVALNIKALGANPILCGVVGKDIKGDTFCSLMKDENLTIEGLLVDENRPTTSKTRIISGSHHMLRVDEEDCAEVSANIGTLLVKKVNELIDTQKIDVIIFEDYDKGLLSEQSIQGIIDKSKTQNIPVCVDPKKNNFNAYQGATLFKPNFKEFITGLNIEVEKSNFDQIHSLAKSYGKDHNIEHLMITLSELGVLWSNQEHKYHVPAQIRNISDVSGAGDTVISIASLSLAKGLSPDKIIKLANLGGGLVCEEVGVVPIDKSKLIAESKKAFQV